MYEYDAGQGKKGAQEAELATKAKKEKAGVDQLKRMKRDRQKEVVKREAETHRNKK